MNVYLPINQLLALRAQARRQMDLAYHWSDWATCDFWQAVHRKLTKTAERWASNPCKNLNRVAHVHNWEARN